MNLQESNAAFLHLLEYPQIKYFLEKDKCMAIMDKYILAAVLLFFRRAEFKKSDYNCKNFYLSLYLIHELYEEIENFKDTIIEHYLGSKSKNKYYYEKFLHDRFSLLRRMDYNGHICKSRCREIMKNAPHTVWNRTRNSKHSGAFYKIFYCKFCINSSSSR